MSSSRRNLAAGALRTGLRAAGVVGVTALVALLGIHHLGEVGRGLDRLAQARIGSAATAAARTLDDDVARFVRLAQGVGPGDMQGDRLALTARMLRMQIALPGTREVFAATAAGRLIAASDPLPGEAPDLAQDDWFVAGLHSDSPGPSIARATVSWIGAAPSLILTMPVRDAAGTVVGLVGAALPPVELRRLMDRAPLPVGASLRLLGPTGAVLVAAHPPPGPPGTPAGGAEPAHLIAEIALRGAPGALSVTAPLRLVPARVVAVMPQDAAWASGWPTRRGEVAGLGLELLGLWVLLGLALLPRGWLGQRGAPARLPAGQENVQGLTPAGWVDPRGAAAAAPSVAAGPIPGPGTEPVPPGAAAARRSLGPSPAEARAEAAEAALGALRREHETALAAVGHDMRTPMQSVLGICDLLLDGALEEDQRHWVEHLRASGAALLALLNGLLALADNGAAAAEVTDLAGLLEGTTTLFAVEAGARQLALHTRLDPALRGSWRVDAARLRQIVVNLLANAVSRTAAGQVELSATAEPGPDGRGMIRVTVTDTGPGITPEDQDRIFEPFQRADAASGGLGLGLALCRENARAMGGSVTLESRPGEGAAFTLICPAEPEPSETRPAAFAGRTALIVGLPEAARAALRAGLEQIGLAVETAADGYLGLALAERTVAVHGALDLVIVDLGVAGMAAESFCMRLRGTAFGASPVLVGLTDRPDAPCPAGMDALLARDGSVGATVAASTALMAGQPALTALLPVEAGAGGGRVLIVEDDVTNRALLSTVLARSGFTAFPAATGEEAVRMAEHDGLDVVLLDLLLPGIDGLETARRIRALPGRSASIPIIALTARTGAAVEAECRTAGLTALVAKPADLEHLAHRLRGWIAAAPRAAAGPGGDSGAPASPVALVSGPFLDAMVSEIGLGRTRACVQEFLDEAGAKCVRLAELIPGWEAGAVLRLCDDLKGLADLFGAVGFSEAIEDLAVAVESGAREPAAEAMARLETGLPVLPEFDLGLPRRHRTPAGGAGTAGGVGSKQGQGALPPGPPPGDIVPWTPRGVPCRWGVARRARGGPGGWARQGAVAPCLAQPPGPPRARRATPHRHGTNRWIQGRRPWWGSRGQRPLALLPSELQRRRLHHQRQCRAPSAQHVFGHAFVDRDEADRVAARLGAAEVEGGDVDPGVRPASRRNGR